jgi:L-asparagine transporter-like permease
MTMVAVGGSIGTGLLLGTAAAIQLAGPAVILTFILAAFVSWSVALALGELASTHPAAGSFGVYARSLPQSIGPASFPAPAIGLPLPSPSEPRWSPPPLTCRFWFPHVPAIVWAFVFSAFLLSINFLSVHSYGRFEFWFAMIKVAVIAAFIALGASLLITGRAAPQYTTHGRIFSPRPTAPLLAITFAIYTFGGVEFVAVTSGESTSAYRRRPRRRA